MSSGGITTKLRPLKTGILLALIAVFYIILPIYLSFRLNLISPGLLSLFYLANIVIIVYLLRKNSTARFQLEYKIQQLQEKLNLIADQNHKELKSSIDLEAKLSRYNSLKKAVDEINEHLEIDSVANKLTLITFSYISDNKGACLLYLIDSNNQKLSLFNTRKEDHQLVIKEKEGDIFDFWVLRHATPLFIEDIRKDFRFDLDRIKSRDSRPLASLISAPFLSENRILGILRLDNPNENFYSQDDLRFLVTVCDLGAVALENSELLQKTHDLAIHDGLTSLFTKGYLLERLKEECIRSRHENSIFSLLMLDIDFFKNYNDRFGHTAGDIVLNKLSAIMRQALAEFNPIIARFGGEEFCVILERTDKKKAFQIAERLRKRIADEKMVLRRQETNITVSIGLASFPVDAREETELIQAADKAMYNAKKSGRNKVIAAK